jgi:hypothetical protein
VEELFSGVSRKAAGISSFDNEFSGFPGSPPFFKFLLLFDQSNGIRALLARLFLVYSI